MQSLMVNVQVHPQKVVLIDLTKKGIRLHKPGMFESVFVKLISLIVLAVMRGATFLLALLATVSAIRSQEILDNLPLLKFPDGSLPELTPRRKVVPEASEELTRADGCPNPCPNFTRPEESDPRWRLSRDVLPSHYEVRHLKCDHRLVIQNYILKR